MRSKPDKIHFKQTTDLKKDADASYSNKGTLYLLSTLEVAALKGVCMENTDCESISTKTISTSKDK